LGIYPLLVGFVTPYFIMVTKMEIIEQIKDQAQLQADNILKTMNKQAQYDIEIDITVRKEIQIIEEQVRKILQNILETSKEPDKYTFSIKISERVMEDEPSQ